MNLLAQFFRIKMHQRKNVQTFFQCAAIGHQLSKPLLQITQPPPATTARAVQNRWSRINNDKNLGGENFPFQWAKKNLMKFQRNWECDLNNKRINFDGELTYLFLLFIPHSPFLLITFLYFSQLIQKIKKIEKNKNFGLF